MSCAMVVVHVIDYNKAAEHSNTKTPISGTSSVFNVQGEGVKGSRSSDASGFEGCKVRIGIASIGGLASSKDIDIIARAKRFSCSWHEQSSTLKENSRRWSIVLLRSVLQKEKGAAGGGGGGGGSAAGLPQKGNAKRDAALLLTLCVRELRICMLSV